MRYLAQNFPGAVLVFSTLRKSLTPKEISGIARIAKLGRKYWKAEHPINPVLILTARELLSWEGPPYCWDEPLQKKFDRSQGLVEFCNSTQQIYLDLPSWHTDWQKKWEEQRQRAAAAARASARRQHSAKPSCFVDLPNEPEVALWAPRFSGR